MPPELKIMILDLLPAKDLLTMALVNKAAREFIHTSPRLMAKFVFVVKNFAEQKSFITEENKKGNSLLFHRVKVMEHISGVRVFKTILGCLKSVIELELHNVTLSSPKRTPYNEIELPNLKILKLMGEFYQRIIFVR